MSFAENGRPIFLWIFPPHESVFEFDFQVPTFSTAAERSEADGFSRKLISGNYN